MASGKCDIAECAAPASCHKFNDDYTKCEHWIKGNQEKPKKQTQKKANGKMIDLSWSGDPIQLENINKLGRSNPIILGTVGRAKAAKTTFLAMLYTLLLNGKKLKHHKFAGTKTILGWDRLYSKLKIQKENVEFPDATLPEYFRLYHLALRNQEGVLKDLFITEASGEVFFNWSQNRNHPDAENARLIYEASHAFIFFIDCKDLAKRKGVAKGEVVDLAQMLNHNLNSRPLIIAWSKADEKKNIHPTILTSLEEELKNQFGEVLHLDISNFPVDDPDALVHENNLQAINWILEKTTNTTKFNKLEVTSPKTKDPFLNYRGK